MGDTPNHGGAGADKNETGDTEVPPAGSSLKLGCEVPRRAQRSLAARHVAVASIDTRLSID